MAFGLLLKGAPKRGKTVLAMQFPNVYVADADNNLSGAVRFFRKTQPTKEFRYDTINMDDNGATVPPEKRWARLCDCCKAAALDPWVKTIVVDSAASVCQYLMDAIIADKKEANTSNKRERIDQMNIADWIPFRNMLTKFVVTFRSVGKYFIMTSHEVWEKDEMTGEIYIRPSIPSNLRDNFGGFFSDEWVLDHEQVGSETKRVVKTIGDARRSMGSSLGLPASFEFDIDKFMVRMNEFNDVVKGKVS